jgi:hypothetical protein
MLSLLSALLAQRPSFPSEFPKMPSNMPSDGGAGILGAICAGGAVMFLLVFVVFMLLPLIGVWKVFSKAGKPGWAAIIPIYNLVILMEIIGQPTSRIIWHIIPFVNIYFAIVDTLALLRTFGKDIGYLIFIMFFPYIAWPMLGFGSATYLGPQAAGGGGAPPPPAPPPQKRSGPPPGQKGGAPRR